MKIEACDIETKGCCGGDNGIVSEIVLAFAEDSEVLDGLCSCICITKECSGCIMQ